MSDSHLFSLIARKFPKPIDSHPVDFTERPHKRRRMGPESAPQRKANRPSLMERLPPELYMAIIQSMNPIEGVLLSLTCRKLWAQVTLQKDVLQDLKRCSPLDETTHFLRMLEKDRHRYVACTACLTLHPRKRDEAKSMGTSVELRKGRPCSEELGVIRTQGPFTKRLVVYRETVELVLRAGIWGQHLGLPLDCLRRWSEWEAFGAGRLKIRFRSDAAIVPVPVQGGGERAHLFLKTGYVVELDLRRSLAAQIKIAEIGGCRHEAKAESEHMIKAIATARSDPVNRRPADVLRCPICPTDLMVEVFYKPREMFAAIHVTAIRDLGPRGHHEDAIWARQKTLYPLRNDFDRRTRYAFGNQMLHLLWESVQKPPDVEGNGAPNSKKPTPKSDVRSSLEDEDEEEDEDSDMADGLSTE